MKTNLIAGTGALLLSALSATAEEAELAKQLANPLAALISLPLQGNLDSGIGAEDGQRFTLNIQPVIPFTLNDDWNLISRTILPVIDVEGTQPGGAGDEFGLGDTVQSLFFSPSQGDLIWGAGPVFLLPTATDAVLGAERWGMGPTAVVLKQNGPWTYGALANHVWDFAGKDSRGPINSTFLQPFCSYITDTKTTFTINSESTYDWTNNQWTTPINLMVLQMLKIGDQPIQVFGGVRYYAEKPQGGPEWGVRFGFTMLFPR